MVDALYHCHEGNVLWTDSPGNTGPHFVDFDDSRTGPAVQDFWMLLGADRVLPCNLTGGQLKGADLTRADVRHALFVDADVSRANFSGAMLKQADFTGVQRHGARGLDDII